MLNPCKIKYSAIFIKKKDCLYSPVVEKDLCRICVENKCVLPSIESVKRQLEDPKAYCIFYMYFYTVAIGEVH
jgi:hypothetical protein